MHFCAGTWTPTSSPLLVVHLRWPFPPFGISPRSHGPRLPSQGVHYVLGLRCGPTSPRLFPVRHSEHSEGVSGDPFAWDAGLLSRATSAWGLFSSLAETFLELCCMHSKALLAQSLSPFIGVRRALWNEGLLPPASDSSPLSFTDVSLNKTLASWTPALVSASGRTWANTLWNIPLWSSPSYPAGALVHWQLIQ